MLATSALWLSRYDECIEKRESAFAGYVKRGQNSSAARVALQLVIDHLNKNASSVAQGWQRRAERLLEDSGDCVEQGYLLRRHAIVAFARGDLERAHRLNQQAREIADRFLDPDLRIMGSHLEGRILLASGDREAGIAVLDEANGERSRRGSLSVCAGHSVLPNDGDLRVAR